MTRDRLQTVFRGLAMLVLGGLMVFALRTLEEGTDIEVGAADHNRGAITAYDVGDRS